MDNRDVQLSFGSAFRGRRVLVTGHTGFKGSWLCEWLLRLGAQVSGYSLPVPTSPALFDQLGLAARLDHRIGDVRSLGDLRTVVREVRPDLVFHLAAQPLVRESYRSPMDTYATNVMGTVHLLEALRQLERSCAVVCITTDKCYENQDWVFGYREDDPLGGYDPYSSSKACAELAISSWRRSFFRDSPVRIASARSGNVIGGGDWAQERIVPDCIRALQQGLAIPVRNASATRPWQHVLEPLSGYLWLAACLAGVTGDALVADATLQSAFNFGPGHEADRSVGDVVTETLKHWPGRWEDRSDPTAVHEASRLQLSIDKAHARLGWRPVWSFPQAVEQTVTWYRQVTADPGQAAALTCRQIETYVADAASTGLPWAAQRMDRTPGGTAPARRHSLPCPQSRVDHHA